MADLRVRVLGPPLQAAGIAAALAGHDGWSVAIGAGDADAYVALGRDALDRLPAAAALVLLDEQRDPPRGASGALALLAVDAGAEQLRAAVAAVLAGLSVRDAVHGWPVPPAPDDSHEPLTPRELEVFELLAKGLSNRDIGGVLGISAHTAKFHVGQILAKVDAATRAEAVSAGLRLGVIGL